MAKVRLDGHAAKVVTTLIAAAVIAFFLGMWNHEGRISSAETSITTMEEFYHEQQETNRDTLDGVNAIKKHLNIGD